MKLKKSFKEQIDILKQGKILVLVEAPATLNSGIQIIEKEKEVFIAKYEKAQKQLDIIKFVPASGAASRMFKDLFLFYEENIFSNEVRCFFENILRFPFADFIKRMLKLMNKTVEDLKNPVIAKDLISIILKNFNYNVLPKGLIPFHLYGKTARTAFEEHFVEAAGYCNGKNGINMYFTVDKKYLPLFRFFLRTFVSDYEKNYHCNYQTKFFIQDPATNTLVVHLDNQPFLDENGEWLLKPAGHGALMKNLNELEADIIFIKNIDNVTIDSRKPLTIKYKKALAGVLLSIQEKIFTYLKAIDSDSLCINSALDFLGEKLNIIFPKTFNNFTEKEKLNFIRRKLNRPLRVCGMVKNEGQIGGGPFWVKKNGEISLQIVESYQIDLEDPAQKKIFEASTHFNPVDIVCGVKDYKGRKFILTQFTDDKAYSIVEKTHEGKPIKSLELPGLWNGAMSKWNTLFVEIPSETFTPVKTVLDLLKPSHLAT